MLRTELETAAAGMPGCRAAGLVGKDGIVVEQWMSGNGPSVEVLAGELTPLLRAVSSLAKHTEAGPLDEVLVILKGWSCLVKPVSDEVFLLLVAGRETAPGRLRYEALKASSRFERELR